jgi:hypothetical protein
MPQSAGLDAREPLYSPAVATQKMQLWVHSCCRLPPFTLQRMSEPAENSDGTVRRIGRPFQPGQ